MSALALLMLQAAPAMPVAPDTSTAPDIEIFAEIQAERVQIEREGEISIELDGSPLADKDQRSQRSQDAGRRTYSNLTIRTRSHVTLADPLVQAQQRAQAENDSQSEPKP